MSERVQHMSKRTHSTIWKLHGSLAGLSSWRVGGWRDQWRKVRAVEASSEEWCMNALRVSLSPSNQNG